MRNWEEFALQISTRSDIPTINEQHQLQISSKTTCKRPVKACNRLSARDNERKNVRREFWEQRSGRERKDWQTVALLGLIQLSPKKTSALMHIYILIWKSVYFFQMGGKTHFSFPQHVSRSERLGIYMNIICLNWRLPNKEVGDFHSNEHY